MANPAFSDIRCIKPEILFTPTGEFLYQQEEPSIVPSFGCWKKNGHSGCSKLRYFLRDNRGQLGAPVPYNLWSCSLSFKLNPWWFFSAGLKPNVTNSTPTSSNKNIKCSFHNLRNPSCPRLPKCRQTSKKTLFCKAQGLLSLRAPDVYNFAKSY